MPSLSKRHRYDSFFYHRQERSLKRRPVEFIELLIGHEHVVTLVQRHHGYRTYRDRKVLNSGLVHFQPTFHEIMDSLWSAEHILADSPCTPQHIGKEIERCSCHKSGAH